MLRTRWIVAGCLIFSAGVSLGACKKDDKADKPADKVAEKPADPAVKPADPAKPAVEQKDGPPKEPIKAGSNVDDLALIPIDAELVMGINFAQVQASALWKDYLAERVISEDVKGTLEELKTKCNIDAMQVAKSASIGVKGMSGGEKEGVIVVHGLDKAKTLACADKIKADKDAKVEVTQDGDVTILKAKSNQKSLAIMFIKDDVAIAVFGSKANAAGVKAVAAATGGLKNSGRFVEMYNKLDTNLSGWMLMSGRSKAFEQLGKMGLKPKAVYSAINLTSGLALDMRMRLESADQATQWAITMKQQLGAAAGMLKFDQVDVVSEGDDLKINITVTAANLGGMMKAMKAIAGMAGGGGGGMAAP